ncbi:proteasome-interacting thioredoxin [Aureococcus anophagefferens]|uniref:Proteasome-interacting thioredoxin n=1 Tax=Aureococcus anophagefferens TaxID=44056 RepID=A0ABR1FXS8_AURAN
MVERFLMDEYNPQQAPRDADAGRRANIWDTAGQERFNKMHPAYYHRAHACILCFDVTRKATYQHLSDWRARPRGALARRAARKARPPAATPRPSTLARRFVASMGRGGHGGAGGGAGHSHSVEYPDDSWNLYQHVDRAEALNAQDGADAARVLRPFVRRLDTDGSFASDGDEEPRQGHARARGA